MTVAGEGEKSIGRHVKLGLAVVVLLLGGMTSWAVATKLAGAVIAPGILVVENNVKKVQHPTGGVVKELRVKDGDKVAAGDLLILLDGTQASASLAIILGGLDELAARKARLEAESEGTDEVAFPAELAARAGEAGLKKILSGEQTLFALRKTERAGQKRLLRERIAQLGQEVDGFTGQAQAKKREIVLVAKELEGTRQLYQQGLMTLARLTDLERSAARLDGEKAQLVASIAQARGRIAEMELEIIQIDQKLRSEVGEQLADLRTKLAELEERRTAARDQLDRLTITAPQSGTVHELAVHTIGGVVRAAESLMLIIPSATALAVDARIMPAEVDRVHPGQKVALRFSTFNQQMTPEIDGILMRVSADVTQDERTGHSFYTARIDIPADQLDRLGMVKLLPGMPVETFIATEERTVLSYLLKPLSDQVMHTFRQE
ncbi:HlyD family type I secretion periplasmic adaptor subunit [Taklimakanibacter lacteus]|uniref:HlyD family type I secretion periplasmic adaptor subunit n=1 Tax=Taklimakanibacter lacteus TaxID=2268456 RepID=UPI000E66FCB0